MVRSKRSAFRELPASYRSPQGASLGLENSAMAQILMILALGTVLTNVTQDRPLPWPWHPDLCQAFGCQEPVKQETCGTDVYNIQTHMCCMNTTYWKVMEKPSPTYDCCGFRVYDQKTQECCEDLSIKPKRNCKQKDQSAYRHSPGAGKYGSLSAAPGGKTGRNG
ncbi:trans-1,2-dihydrobenzene-1,2-diol dehydrogenase-like [Platysternon megacephalum]|uniref:Trans-1,2-dihydrobenzene-1,2-diol dehydrogenase-like n=1 Tax=Platysternon megacephalum TaxID=55544 RepID=A0A4D9DT09_9SAUR|nr:trans-1,2-dihydrobenzene-1,2-diol dehydrogenase-like [Platysternon megacephalum]